MSWENIYLIWRKCPLYGCYGTGTLISQEIHYRPFLRTAYQGDNKLAGVHLSAYRRKIILHVLSFAKLHRWNRKKAHLGAANLTLYTTPRSPIPRSSVSCIASTSVVRKVIWGEFKGLKYTSNFCAQRQKLLVNTWCIIWTKSLFKVTYIYPNQQ